MTKQKSVDAILEKLVVSHLPAPLSIPPKFARKCIEKAKNEIDHAKTDLHALVKRCVVKKKNLDDGRITDTLVSMGYNEAIDKTLANINVAFGKEEK